MHYKKHIILILFYLSTLIYFENSKTNKNVYLYQEEVLPKSELQKQNVKGNCKEKIKYGFTDYTIDLMSTMLNRSNLPKMIA